MMNIEDEMLLWETRSNDEFGQVLKKICKATIDYLPSWEYMGIEYNMLSEYITGYSLDGDRKYTASAIHNVLYNYDILSNHKNIKKLVETLFELSK